MLCGTDNVQGQISYHIFTEKMVAIVFIILQNNIFHNTYSFENCEIFSDIPQLKLGISGHVMHLDQSRKSKNI